MEKTKFTFDNERYHSAFAEWFRGLIDGPDDIRKIAEHLGVSQQAVNQFKLGQAFPKVENLLKLAKYFDCSLDYLIGMSDVKTPLATAKAACEYTGLSESAIEHLHTCVEELDKGNSYFEIVSCLLSSDDFYNSIAFLKRALEIENSIAAEKEASPEGFNALQGFMEAVNGKNNRRSKKSGIMLSHRQGIDFYLQAAVNTFRRLCDNIVKGDS